MTHKPQLYYLKLGVSGSTLNGHVCMMFCLKRICELFCFVFFSFLLNRLSIEPRQYLSLVRHKPGCTSTEDSQSRLELSDLEGKGVAKTDALISYALTAQLVCSFDFAYAKSRFSCDAAQMITLFV